MYRLTDRTEAVTAHAAKVACASEDGAIIVRIFIWAIDGHFAWSERVSARISTCG